MDYINEDDYLNHLHYKLWTSTLLLRCITPERTLL